MSSRKYAMKKTIRNYNVEQLGVEAKCIFCKKRAVIYFNKASGDDYPFCKNCYGPMVPVKESVFKND